MTRHDVIWKLLSLGCMVQIFWKLTDDQFLDFEFYGFQNKQMTQQNKCCWTQGKRSSIKINFLVTSNGVLQYTQITQPSEERSLLQRLALISWCTQLNVLGQRFPGTSPRDQYPLSGIWEVIGWRAWDANYIMRLLHHKHNPGLCMYVYICKNLFTLQGTWCRVR